ncbi:Alpha/Beta hydrolase protein [Hypoxylon sp. NC0597]|nr:Alpha/Beta hydrolase protein [Hypoxylon sp. NC0597]
MCAKRGGGGETPSATEIPSAIASGPGHKLLTPESDAAWHRPLIICFHGSGESCSPSWDALARILTSEPHFLRVLLYERGPRNPKPPQATADLRKYLRMEEKLKGPYVLVAHSYGGSFARLFLDKEDTQVAGMVLVETGQESALDAKIEERQYERRILGMRPLSVVRGNSFLRISEQVRQAEAEANTEREGARDIELKKMLRTWEAADEEMKKKQLELAAQNGVKRYVHIQDCGHHVVRDRPDVVAAEVAWVLENLGDGTSDSERVKQSEGEKGTGLWKLWWKMIGELVSGSKK